MKMSIKLSYFMVCLSVRCLAANCKSLLFVTWHTKSVSHWFYLYPPLTSDWFHLYLSPSLSHQWLCTAGVNQSLSVCVCVIVGLFHVFCHLLSLSLSFVSLISSYCVLLILKKFKVFQSITKSNCKIHRAQRHPVIRTKSNLTPMITFTTFLHP